MTGTSFGLELVPLRGENEFESHPQNVILGSFQNFRPSPPPFLYGSPPRGFYTLDKIAFQFTAANFSLYEGSI